MIGGGRIRVFLVVGLLLSGAHVPGPRAGAQENHGARPVERSLPALEEQVPARNGRPSNVVTIAVEPYELRQSPRYVKTPEAARFGKTLQPGDRPIRAPRPAPRHPIEAYPSGTRGGVPEPSVAPLMRRFDTIDFDTNAIHTGSLFVPADSAVAAGPDHVVVATNVTLRFHGKDGSLDPANDMSLEDFFAGTGPRGQLLSPKVLYDQHAERFLVVVLEFLDLPLDDRPNDEVSSILLAVSDDSNPEGTWYLGGVPAKVTYFCLNVDPPGTGGDVNFWTGFPGVAVDEEAIYLTGSLFEFSSKLCLDNPTAFGGVRLRVVPKGQFYAGGPPLMSASVSPFGPAPDCFFELPFCIPTQPAHVFGDPDTIYGESNVFGTYLVTYSGLTDGTNEYLQVVRVDNALTTFPTFTAQAPLLVADVEDALGPLPDAPQAGSTSLIETNDRSVLDAVWRDDGGLYLTANVLPNAGPDSGQATAHWFQLDTTDPDLASMVDHGDVGGEDVAAGASTFFPSIAVNEAGDVAIGFSASGPTLYPGSFVASRSASDPPGSVGASRVLRHGVDYYERTFGLGRNLWGNYSTTAVDPVDQCFWAYNQHAIARGTPTTEPDEDGRWSTAAGYLCEGCPTEPLTLDLSGMTLSGKEFLGARNEIVAGDSVLSSTAKVEMITRAASFGDGFRVDLGGSLAVHSCD